MKKKTFFLLLLATMVVSCNPDDPTNSSDDVSTADTVISVDINDEEDNMANTTFDRTIAIVYSSSGATVTGDDYGIVTTDGNDVTVHNATGEKIIYQLSGTATDGFFKVYSTKKQAIEMKGLTLTNKRGAAINNQSSKRCFVVVEGTNVIADGTTYSETPSDEDEKAALFSEGQLIFSGDGSLTVGATGKAGITSDDYVKFMGTQTVSVTSTAGHGVRGKDAVIIADGTLTVSVSANTKKGITSDTLVYVSGGVTTIDVSGSAAYDSDDAEYKGTAGVKADVRFEITGGTLTVTNKGSGGKGISGDGAGVFTGGTVSITTAGSNYGSSGGGGGGWGRASTSDSSVSAKGIKFDGNVTFDGADVSVSCAAHEGIEAKGTITITDGTVYSYSAADDAVNSGSTFTVTGGYLCGYAPKNDGLDANGNFYLKGGTVYAIGSTSPEVAIDANTEGGYKLYVQGGTIVAIGGLESGASLSQSCYQASSWAKSTWYALTIGSTTFCFKTPASGGTGLMVSGSSSPTLTSGVTVTGGTTLFGGMATTGSSVSGGTAVSLSSYSGGNSGGGPGGGGRW